MKLCIMYKVLFSMAFHVVFIYLPKLDQKASIISYTSANVFFHSQHYISHTLVSNTPVLQQYYLTNLVSQIIILYKYCRSLTVVSQLQSDSCKHQLLKKFGASWPQLNMLIHISQAGDILKSLLLTVIFLCCHFCYQVKYTSSHWLIPILPMSFIHHSS